MNSDQIMKLFETLTEFLGIVLDSNCEIALLDLRENRKCITAIANGHNSNRQVGAPITDLALRIIREETWKTRNFLTNYPGLTIDGRPLISSTYFIRKDADTLLGMFCINIKQKDKENLRMIYRQINELYKNLGGLLFPDSIIPGMSCPAQEGTPAITENFVNSYEDMIAAAIRACLADPSIPPERLTQPEKMDIVKKLESDGFFLIKGSVQACAKKLNCSEATVYRYISKIK